jgi:uncharacterized protein (TIGR00730 family)
LASARILLSSHAEVPLVTDSKARDISADAAGPLPADRDLELLARPELRSVRLQLEYLKPELALRAAGIDHTIVVFGSTRFDPPDLAKRKLEEAERACALAPGEPDCRDAMLAAERAVERSRYYTIAQEFGRIVGRAGSGPGDSRLVVVTGGGPGAMEAANRGAHDVGAQSCGLNITLPREQSPNPFITPELSISFRYFALRKLHFMLRARGLVAFPGGYGTLDELFEVLCLIQTRKREALPIVLVGREFWSRAIDFDFLLETEMISPADLDVFVTAETAQEAWDAIESWYASRGRSIFEGRSQAEDVGE